MERALYVLFCSGCDELRGQILMNLSWDKPVLVDEVEDAWKDVYVAFEYISVPEQIYFFPAGKVLVRWPLCIGDEPDRYMQSFSKVALDHVGGIEAFEDGGYCFIDPAGSRSTSPESGEEEVFDHPQRVFELIERRRASCG